MLDNKTSLQLDLFEMLRIRNVTRKLWSNKKRRIFSINTYT